jgi:hypothetical protein
MKYEFYVSLPDTIMVVGADTLDEAYAEAKVYLAGEYGSVFAKKALLEAVTNGSEF